MQHPELVAVYATRTAPPTPPQAAWMRRHGIPASIVAGHWPGPLCPGRVATSDDGTFIFADAGRPLLVWPCRWAAFGDVIDLIALDARTCRSWSLLGIADADFLLAALLFGRREAA